MSSRSPLAAAFLFLAAQLAGGCVSDVDSDPNGSDAYPLCVAREAAAELAFTVTNDWPVEGEPGSDWDKAQSLELGCEVATTSATQVTLTCSDAVVTDGTFAINFDMTPAAFEHGLTVGESLTLDYDLAPPGLHQDRTEWLTIHAASDDSVALVIGDYGTLGNGGLPSVQGLALAVDNTICPNPCADGMNCDDPRRAAISIDAAATLVLDGTSQTVTAGQQDLTVFVAESKSYSCLNCNSDLMLAITRAGASQ